MSMRTILTFSLLALNLPLAAVEGTKLSSPAKVAELAKPSEAPKVVETPVAAAVPSSPSAQAPVAPVAASPAPLSPVAKAMPPELPLALSGSSEALSAPVAVSGDAGIAEEVGEDGALSVKTETPDLSKLDSETLASMAAGVTKETVDLFYDPIAKQALPEAASGAWRSSVDALYNELARRTLNDTKDKAARQAFALTLFKDSERAKFAKDQAYDDKLAEAVIAQVEAKRPRARMELQGLAEKGNRKARLYLGLDKPLAREEAGALSPSAQAVSASATVLPMAVTPQAEVKTPGNQVP